MPKHEAISVRFEKNSSLYDYLLGWVRLYSFMLQKLVENTKFAEKIRESISGKLVPFLCRLIKMAFYETKC